MVTVFPLTTWRVVLLIFVVIPGPPLELELENEENLRQETEKERNSAEAQSIMTVEPLMVVLYRVHVLIC